MQHPRVWNLSHYIFIGSHPISSQPQKHLHYSVHPTAGNHLGGNFGAKVLIGVCCLREGARKEDNLCHRGSGQVSLLSGAQRLSLYPTSWWQFHVCRGRTNSQRTQYLKVVMVRSWKAKRHHLNSLMTKVSLHALMSFQTIHGSQVWVRGAPLLS